MIHLLFLLAFVIGFLMRNTFKYTAIIGAIFLGITYGYLLQFRLLGDEEAYELSSLGIEMMLILIPGIGLTLIAFILDIRRILLNKNTKK